MKSKRLLILPAVILLAFTACKKDSNNNPADNEIQTSIDNSVAQNEFSGIQALIDMEARSDTSVWKTGGTTRTEGIYCPGSNVSASIIGADSAEMTVDFGSGCLCADGRFRTGKLNAVFTGRWRDVGTKAVITPDGYTSNSNAITFTKTITYEGTNSSGQDYWTVDVDNAVVYTSSGNISWECTRTTTFIAGKDTPLDLTDNEYHIEGEGSGTSRTGIPFTVRTDEPLHIKLNCSNIVAGRYTLTPSGLNDRIVDYGDGTCDNKATLTIGSWTIELTLP